MSTQYIDLLKRYLYIQQEIDKRKDEILAESKVKGEVYRAHKSILKILHTHCPDLFDKIVELPKRLERIQNIEALEEIEDAGLASDEQHAQTLIETNAPLEWRRR